MNWLALMAYFFGGVFVANAVPHWVAGLMGRSFQTPFAKPPGKGLSSPTVNVLWGLINVVFSYLLTVRVGAFHLRVASHVIAFGLGVLAISLQLARHFGQFHSGDAPSRS